MKGAGILLGLLLVYAAVMVQGCVVAAVGAGAAGTVAYIRGDLEVIMLRGWNSGIKYLLFAFRNFLKEVSHVC